MSSSSGSTRRKSDAAGFHEGVSPERKRRHAQHRKDHHVRTKRRERGRLDGWRFRASECDVLLLSRRLRAGDDGRVCFVNSWSTKRSSTVARWKNSTL